MRILLPVLLGLAACASSSVDRPGPRMVPGEPVVVSAEEFPEEITGLLTAAEADSCGVCVREKQAEAIEFAGKWFAPGHLVIAGASPGWWLLPGEDPELYFGEAGDASPRLTFRFHTEENHLVGIAPEDFTDPRLAARILGRANAAAGSEVLEVIRFPYGDGESFVFDEARNRLQVQCRVIDPASPDSTTSKPYGSALRGSGRR